VLFGEHIDRKYHHHVIVWAPAAVVQECRGQCDRRKGIPSLRFRDDIDGIAQLGEDLFTLRRTCRNNHMGIGKFDTELAEHPLKHRFMATGTIFEHTKKLFRPDFIGKWPEPFARATRQKDHMYVHMVYYHLGNRGIQPEINGIGDYRILVQHDIIL
jgi:hypothetical protein